MTRRTGFCEQSTTVTEICRLQLSGCKSCFVFCNERQLIAGGRSNLTPDRFDPFPERFIFEPKQLLHVISMHVGSGDITLFNRIEQFGGVCWTSDKCIDSVALFIFCQLSIPGQDCRRNLSVVVGRQRPDCRSSQCRIIQRGKNRSSAFGISTFNDQLKRPLTLVQR